LGSPFNASPTTCVWNKFFEKWNSGSNTTATISIVNQNTATNGNDFSLDDISFNKVSYHYDECTVNVTNIPGSDFTLANKMCSLDTTIVTYTGIASDTANYIWDFGDATVISGSGQGPYNLQWSNSGNKSISLQVEEFCYSPTTQKEIEVNESPSVQLTADASTIPYGTTTFLHGGMSGNPGPFSFQWQPDSKLQDPGIQDPETVILNNSTLFTFIATDQTSLCVNQDTLTIMINGGPLALLSVEALPDSICKGQNTDIQISIEGGSGDYQATWTSSPPGFHHSGPETTINVNPTENTTYYVEVYDGFSNTPIDSVDIWVVPQIEIGLNPSDTVIEVGQTAIFKVEADNLLSYQWQLSTNNGSDWQNLIDNAVYSGVNTNTLTVNNATVEMNLDQYRCLLEGKCTPVFSLTATLLTIFSPDFIGELPDTEVCEGKSFLLACNITNFVKIDSLELIFTFDDNYLQFTELQNISTGLSSLQYYQNHDSIIVSWSETNGLNVSDGEIFDIEFIAINDGNASVDFSNSSFVRNSYGFLPELNFSSSGIIINPLPRSPDYIIATPDSLNILDEVNIELEVFGGSGEEVLWSLDTCGGTQLGSGSNITVFRPEITAKYFALWQNQCGQSECKSAVVQITENYIISAPTAFSPNGDGINDEFGILSAGKLSSFELQIFNRWGQMIFSSDDQEKKWDGKIDGKESPPGVYIWKVYYRYRSESDKLEAHQNSGTVLLLD